MPHRVWRMANGRSISLDRPRIIAVLNLTPDSFHEASRVPSVGAAVEAARRAVGEGADALDLGGESTRPGAARVSQDEQIERVVPSVRAIRAAGGPLGDVPISVDTTHGAVARAALDAGADAVNDVAAGTEDPAMFPLIAERGAGVILMHRLVPPDRDSYSDRYAIAPAYDDVAGEVAAYLAEGLRAATDAGIHPESVVLDPGLGFGKTVEQNAELMRGVGRLQALGRPILCAVSRKSFVGRLSSPGVETTPSERLTGSVALAVQQCVSGVRLFRVHDVREHAEALRAVWGVMAGG
ncbi:MAG TPA: dihydropteroate synthase [Phycisphaerales bacterium]|nr:dihydropteroate synthase [Phycisphaerales bacterium]